VIIRDLQKRYQKDIVEASRDALKAEASARLARLRLKEDEHTRLCAMRCDKYNDFVKVVPCRTVADLEALRARHADDLKACAEALRDQIRVRLHVYKVKAASAAKPRGGRGSPHGRAARGGGPRPAEGPAAAGSVPDPLGAPSPDSCGGGLPKEAPRGNQRGGP